MKEIKRTRTIEEVECYEANDGSRFTTKEECEKYEKSAQCAVETAFKKGVVNHVAAEAFYNVIPSCCFEDEVYFYPIKTAEDVKLLNMLVPGGSDFGTDWIGKTAVVCWGYDGYCALNWTPEKFKEEYCALIDRLCKPEEKKEGEK